MNARSKPRRQPIADKVLKKLLKESKKDVIDISTVKAGRKQAAELQQTVAKAEDLAKLPPSYAAYVWAQNQLSVMAEQLLAFNALHRIADILEESSELYEPQGPPMSPLTRTYYTNWSMCDVGVGMGRESLGSIAIAVNRKWGAHENFIELAQNLVDSRCGIYQVLRTHGDGVVELKELWTNIEFTARNASGYDGSSGELWYIRTLPPSELEPDVHIIFNTPYVLYETSTDAWMQYFERVLAGVEESKRATKFNAHMKYGAEPFYWTEYVFYSYVNYTSGSIFVKGLPDIPESLPHKDEYQKTRIW